MDTESVTERTDDRQPAGENVIEDRPDGAPDGAAPGADAKQHDPDAAWGVKTSKHGKDESFYGYHEHTLVRVPDRNQEKDTEPRLIARFELTPADEDVVEVSFSLLDRVGTPVRKLLVDRHYPYKTVERWRDPLIERGTEQVFDLRVDQHGFTELDHTRWAAGWPHCPATPDHLDTILRPAPNAPKSESQVFRNRIAERRKYAFRRVTTPGTDGTARWECPAVAGAVGCPLRPGTVEAQLELGGPIIKDHPDPQNPDFPTCCTQRTVTLQPGPLRKLMQADYWGSDEWEDDYKKRTYVEGTYGNRKNRSTEDLTRGHLRISGIAPVQIATAMAAVAYNLRMLRNWHERTGLRDDDHHPLLKADEEAYDWAYLTPAQAAALAGVYGAQAE